MEIKHERNGGTSRAESKPRRAFRSDRSVVTDLSNERETPGERVPGEDDRIDRKLHKTVRMIARYVARPRAHDPVYQRRFMPSRADFRNAIHAVRAIRQIGRIIASFLFLFSFFFF